MASKGSSVKEDNCNEKRGTRRGRRNALGRPPHRFTDDDLQILKQSFEQNAFPDFTQKEELAHRIHCNVDVIANWFQNRRARLPPGERQRVLASRRQHQLPVEGSSFPPDQNTQAQSDTCFTEQGSFPCRESPGDGVRSSSLETQRVQAEQVGPSGFLAKDMNTRPSSSLEYPGSSEQEDNYNAERGSQCERRNEKGRPRHRFTDDDLQILKQVFEQNPYPDLTDKQELANGIHCDVYVIDKWFRNRRTRLTPREKQRVFALRKLHQFPARRSSFPFYWNTQAQPANYSSEQVPFPCQESPVGGGRNSSMETQQGPVGQVDSCCLQGTGMNVDPVYALEYPGGSRSAASYSAIPANFTCPTASGQYFRRADYESVESQCATLFCSHQGFSVQGMGHQQEGQRVPDQYPVFQVQQPSIWGHHLPQVPQPQHYYDNYQLTSQDQFQAYQSPRDLGLQVSSTSQQQNSGKALCCQWQNAPVPIMHRSPSVFACPDMQQLPAEQARSEIQPF